MQTDIIEKEHSVVYTIKDAPVEYHETLLHLFFSRSHGQYEKEYLKESLMFVHNMDTIKRNFDVCLEPMILNFMEKQCFDFDAVMDKMLSFFEHQHIRYWLTGSAACKLRGIDLIPHDIDVMTYKSELHKIEQGWNAHIIEPFHHITDWVVKGFGVVWIDARIDSAFEPEDQSDVDGNLDFGCFAQQHLEPIVWNDHTILVPPVDLHLLSNTRRKRVDRVQKITEYLQQTSDFQRTE